MRSLVLRSRALAKCGNSELLRDNGRSRGSEEKLGNMVVVNFQSFGQLERLLQGSSTNATDLLNLSSGSFTQFLRFSMHITHPKSHKRPSFDSHYLIHLLLQLRLLSVMGNHSLRLKDYASQIAHLAGSNIPSQNRHPPIILHNHNNQITLSTHTELSRRRITGRCFIYQFHHHITRVDGIR